MPTAQEMLQDPFTQQLLRISQVAQIMANLWMGQGNQTSPLRRMALASMNSTPEGVAFLQSELSSGITQLQTLVVGLVVPEIQLASPPEEVPSGESSQGQGV